MNRIVDIYESNHLLILVILVILLGVYIKSIKKNNYFSKIENVIEDDSDDFDKLINTDSEVKLKYILSGEIITLKISENQSNKYKNKSETRRLYFQLPLAEALTDRKAGDIIKFKVDELKEEYTYIEILDVNNEIFTKEEIESFKAMTETEEFKSENPDKSIPTQIITNKNLKMQNIERSKCFFIRRNRLGENIIVEFKDKYGFIWHYNHDLVYKELKDKYENMPAFLKYDCYTSNNTIPAYVQELDCCKIQNKKK